MASETEPRPEPSTDEARDMLLYRAQCAEELRRFDTETLTGIKAEALQADLRWWLEKIGTGADTLPIDETGVVGATEKVIAALDELIALRPDSK